MPKANIEVVPAFRGFLASRGLRNLVNPFTDANGEYALSILRRQGVFRFLGDILEDELPSGPDCRRLREVAGIRRSWLAAAVSLPEGVLATWEAGDRGLSDGMLDDTVGIEGVRVLFAAIRAWAEEVAPDWRAQAERSEQQHADAVAEQRAEFDEVVATIDAATAKIAEAATAIEVAMGASRTINQQAPAATLERAMLDLEDLAKAVARGKAQLNFQPTV